MTGSKLDTLLTKAMARPQTALRLIDATTRIHPHLDDEDIAALMGGAPIGEALRRTRVSLAREIGEGTTPWGAYALYGDPRTVYAASAVQVAAPRRATRLGHPTSTPGTEKIRRAEAAPAAVATRAPRQPWTDALEFAGVLVLIVALTASALWWLPRGAHARFENFPESTAP